MTLTALLHALFASYAQAASGNAPEEPSLRHDVALLRRLERLG